MITKNIYKILEWDTKFFGYKIGKITGNNITVEDLKDIINNMKYENYKLVYWFVQPNDKTSIYSAKNENIFLADEKITYRKVIEQYKNYLFHQNIKSYELPLPNDKLISLSLQSGIFSRFRIDPNFKHDEYKRLYTAWIENSVKKLIAKYVLIYFDNNTELGMITLDEKNNYGEIGLLAVDERSRGKSIGKYMIEAAKYKVNQWGKSEIRVVTQRDNKVACKFYENCLFEIYNVEYVYHIWIDQNV